MPGARPPTCPANPEFGALTAPSLARESTRRASGLELTFSVWPFSPLRLLPRVSALAETPPHTPQRLGICHPGKAAPEFNRAGEIKGSLLFSSEMPRGEPLRQSAFSPGCERWQSQEAARPASPHKMDSSVSPSNQTGSPCQSLARLRARCRTCETWRRGARGFEGLSPWLAALR